MSDVSKARRRRRNKTRAGARAVAIRDVCDFLVKLGREQRVSGMLEVVERIERHFAPAQAPE